MYLRTLGPDSFDEFVGNNDIAIIDFYANWCGPCVQMMKILPGLAERLQGIAVVGKVDVDTNYLLKERFTIKSIPTFIFFKKGQEMSRHNGILRLEEIREIVENLLVTI